MFKNGQNFTYYKTIERNDNDVEKYVDTHNLIEEDILLTDKLSKKDENIDIHMGIAYGSYIGVDRKIPKICKKQGNINIAAFENNMDDFGWDMAHGTD